MYPHMGSYRTSRPYPAPPPLSPAVRSLWYVKTTYCTVERPTPQHELMYYTHILIPTSMPLFSFFYRIVCTTTYYLLLDNNYHHRLGFAKILTRAKRASIFWQIPTSAGSCFIGQAYNTWYLILKNIAKGGHLATILATIGLSTNSCNHDTVLTRARPC